MQCLTPAAADAVYEQAPRDVMAHAYAAQWAPDWFERISTAQQQTRPCATPSRAPPATSR